MTSKDIAMRHLLLAAVLSAMVGAARAQVHDASFRAADGSRTLQEWIDIKAPARCVWDQLTDEIALKASGMAFAHVDLRNGGLLEEGFTPDAKPADRIRHQIVTYLPERLLVLRNLSTPMGLPGAELYPTIVQVIELQTQGPGVTRLTIAHTGYGQGSGYDQLYGFFRSGNGQYLKAAQKACEPQ